MKNFLKKTFKILIVILLIIIVIIVSSVAIGRFYKDEIRNYVISEINNEIEVKVNVHSAEFSVLRKFPFVSIVLTDVAALPGNDFIHSQFTGMSYDTLFTASRIYLQFNIIDILNKDYRLRKVHAVNGKITILVDSEGGINYRIFKESKKVKSPGNLTLSLDGVKMSNFSWQYLNIAKDIYSEGEIKELAFKGKFSQNSFSLNTLSSFFISTFNREGIEYASKLNIIARIILSVRDSVYTISKGELSLNDLNLKTGGSFIYGSKTSMDIHIAGERLSIESLISILPFNTDNLKQYAPSGKIDILAKILGEISATAVPAIRTAFKVTNGKVFLPGQGSNISGIEVHGNYTNGSQRNAASSRLNFSSYSINYGKNQLNGKLRVDNFISPYLSASLSGTIIAKDLSEIIKIDGLSLEQGFIYPDLFVHLYLDSFKSFKIENISGKGISGDLNFKQISGKIPYPDIPFDLLEGNIKMEGETWLPVIRMKFGKNKISANLVVNHFWDYFINHSDILGINGNITSEYFNVIDFTSNSNSTENTDFQMPDSIYLKLHCNVDSLIYRKFIASGLETWFSYKPGLLSVTSVNMQAMSGKVSAGGAIIEDNQGQMLLRTSGDLYKIDIYKLFDTFNNFGQDFIVAENIKGSASGSLNFSVQISPELKLLSKTLTAESDFVIENGELINFEPVTELSSFIALSELKHIRFSTLKNSILIKDEKVYIPQMDINSSAFNITVSGTHGFENYFEYKLRLSLNEILSGKAKKAKKENEEFGIVEDNGPGKTNLYLSITGTPDDFKIRYDKKEAVNKIKSDLQVEKKLLKTILNEELGLFKGDSLKFINTESNPQNGQFIMDWGDEIEVPEKAVKNRKERKLKKQDPLFEITWEEEDPELK